MELYTKVSAALTQCGHFQGLLALTPSWNNLDAITGSGIWGSLPAKEQTERGPRAEWLRNAIVCPSCGPNHRNIDPIMV